MRQIFVFSQIDSYLAEFVIRQLLALDRESSDEITMFINSPGGSVYQMFAIIDTMKIIKSPVRTVVIGIAASAAACLASSGNTRLISSTAQVMIHEASAGAFGSVSDMQEEMEQISKLNESMMNMLAANTKQPLSVIKEATNKKDKYMSAQEAVSFGIADKVINDSEAQVLKLSEGINVEGYEFSLDNKEVQLLREGKFVHPAYGEVLITESALSLMKKHFDAKVRGIDLSIDYTHDNDNGEKPAAFWIRSLEVKQNLDGKGKGLFAKGEFTPKGAKLVAEKEYRYSSADFVIDYVAEDGKHHPYVLRGGTLTNRPFIKNMNPIKLSEYKPMKKEINQMNEKELIAALKAHGIDVLSLQAQGTDLTAKVRELEAKITELNALPAQKEAEIKALKDKLLEASTKIVEAEKVKVFEALVKEGKCIPAQKDQVFATFKTGADISAFYQNAPVVVTVKAKGHGSEGDGEGEDELSAEEQTLVDAKMYTKEEILANRTINSKKPATK